MKKIPITLNYHKITLESTPDPWPLIFLQLVQRAGDNVVSVGLYYIAVTFFMIKEAFVFCFLPLN